MNPRPEVKSDPRRALPSVDRLARALTEAEPGLPAWSVRESARIVLGRVRSSLGKKGAEGGLPETETLLASARDAARRMTQAHPQRVINATGIALHTNLGRAPLSASAADAVAAVARSYGDLELDLESGKRGSRTSVVERQLRWLTGAGGAVVVNNNAAAIFLVLAGLAHGRAAVVSRGELVEIGGSFRVPDIMASAGVRLLEVGTTNRTHLRDYASAIGPETAMLLKVHRSNFAQSGFTAEVGLPALSELAREHGVPLVEDLGSGTLLDWTRHGFPAETYAPGRIAAGADVVCFSGDKLLGGPQAGLILTREAETADTLRRHPLARALRLDKLTLSALDWTLRAYLEGRAESEIPVVRALLAKPEVLREAAERLTRRLDAVLPDGARVRARSAESFAGGGSLPDHRLESWVVELESPLGAERLAARLRDSRPAVLARIQDDTLRFDVRTLLDGDEDDLVERVAAALR